MVDGTGGEPFEADVAIADGRIAAVGPRLARGHEEIDAKGQLVRRASSTCTPTTTRR